MERELARLRPWSCRPGSFFTSTDTNTVAGDGVIRGSFLANGTATPVRIDSGAATVPDGNGNNIFGAGTGSLPISGFVLDQNQYNTNLNFVPNQAAFQGPVGGSASSYGFNQPATPTTNTGLGTRTTQTTTGYFGGIMYPVVGGSPARLTPRPARPRSRRTRPTTESARPLPGAIRSAPTPSRSNSAASPAHPGLAALSSTTPVMLRSKTPTRRRKSMASTSS